MAQWPNIPTLIYTDSVQFRTMSWGKGSSGGRKETPGVWSQSFNCSISAASADDIMTHSRESMQVSHVVTMNRRLGGIRDQFLWEETGTILGIVSIEPAGDGRGRIWNHYVQEYSTK